MLATRSLCPCQVCVFQQETCRTRTMLDDDEGAASVWQKERQRSRAAHEAAAIWALLEAAISSNAPSPDADRPLGRCTPCSSTQPQLQQRADGEARDRWAARRARHVPWDEQRGRGSAEGTRAALTRASRRTLICQAPGCCALVDRGRARFQAHAEGRMQYAQGDGCAGPGCSSAYQPPRFAARQRAMAAQLERGERQLVAWPRGLEDGETWVYPAEVARDAAAMALRALDEAPRRYGRRRR